MNVKTKMVEPFGYKGDGIHSNAPSYRYYYRADQCGLIILDDWLDDFGIYFYEFTPKLWAKWKKNKLAIIPPGCCGPSPGEKLERYKNLYQGKIRNRKQLEGLLSWVDSWLTAPGKKPLVPA